MRARRQPRRRHLGLVAAVLALVLAACGGADPAPNGEPGEADPSASAETADDPVDAPAEEPTEAPQPTQEPAEEPAEEPADPPAREDDDPEPGTDAQDADGEDTAAAVPALLDFTAPAVGGGTVRGADHVGKPVALWFWAPW